MDHRPRVAVKLALQDAYGRSEALGVARYVAAHRPWRVELSVAGPGTDALSNLDVDGLIMPVVTSAQRDRVLSLGIPVVSIVGSLGHYGLPVVISDNPAVGRMAAEFFLDRGFDQLAFCGVRGRYYSTRRGDGFRAVVRAAGLDCHESHLPGYPHRRSTPPRLIERLAEWVRQLPKPIGVFVSDDIRAVEFAEACRVAAIDIPEQVAVLSVNNDELTCNLSSPPLSSIDHGAEQIGYEAAALLDRLLQGAAPPAGPIIVAPRRIVHRRSTDTWPRRARGLNAALACIHANLHRRLQVDEVVAAAGTSRRSLEMAFRRELGRTILQEMQRQQVEEICRLLSETNLSLKQIADRLGFNNVYYFSTFVKKHVGVPPATFRKQQRGPNAFKIQEASD